MVTPKSRSTIDLVVIILTTMVALSVVLAIIGVTVMKLANPTIDTKGAAALVGNVLTTVVGALVGFIGGRATGKAEARNGE